MEVPHLHVSLFPLWSCLYTTNAEYVLEDVLLLWWVISKEHDKSLRDLSIRYSHFIFEALLFCHIPWDIRTIFLSHFFFCRAEVELAPSCASQALYQTSHLSCCYWMRSITCVAHNKFGSQLTLDCQIFRSVFGKYFDLSLFICMTLHCKNRCIYIATQKQSFEIFRMTWCWIYTVILFSYSALYFSLLVLMTSNRFVIYFVEFLSFVKHIPQLNTKSVDWQTQNCIEITIDFFNECWPYFLNSECTSFISAKRK